jgi:hypothetical protein
MVSRSQQHDPPEPRIPLPQFGEIVGDRILDTADQALVDGVPIRVDRNDLATEKEVWSVCRSESPR